MRPHIVGGDADPYHIAADIPEDLHASDRGERRRDLLELVIEP